MTRNLLLAVPALLVAGCNFFYEAEPAPVGTDAEMRDGGGIDVRACGEEGSACNDNDLCTIGDVCQADGTCAGEPVDCTPDECSTGGACNPETGSCVFESNREGEACDDDGLECTDDVCSAGRCTHPRLPFYCVIDGACVGQDDISEEDDCLICDTETDSFNWSVGPDGVPCSGGICVDGACQR